MNKIQLLTIFLAFLLILSGCNRNQDRPGFGQGQNFDPKVFAEQRAERVGEALELSEEQIAKLTELYLKYGEKQRELRQESGGDRETMRAKMQEFNAEQDSEMKEILTEEQWDKWLEVRNSFRQRREGGPRGGRQ